jgi:energy-coupling factor transporter ATP-binding protein EcfA2
MIESMTRDSGLSSWSNPFCSRFLKPGHIPFCFPGTESIKQLADRIRAPHGQTLGNSHGKSLGQDLRLAIVGPHGTGKSTLLHHLSQELRRNCPSNRHALLGKAIHAEPTGLVLLHSSSNKLGALSSILRQLYRSDWCLIDGYEQIPRWGQFLVMTRARRSGVPLCVTAHRLPWKFQLLWHTRVDPQVESHVIDCLLASAAGQAPGSAKVKSSLLESPHWAISRQKHRDNLRESLFDMYDWWQATVDDFSGSR